MSKQDFMNMKSRQASPSSIIDQALFELLQSTKRLKQTRTTFSSIAVSAAKANSEATYVIFAAINRYIDLLDDSLERLDATAEYLRRNYLAEASLLERVFGGTRRKQPKNLQVPIAIIEGVTTELRNDTESLVEWFASFMAEVGALFSVQLSNAFKDVTKFTSKLDGIKRLLIEAELVINTRNTNLPEQVWDFVKNEELRLLLSRDYQELGHLVSIGARKSALVMCGSIIEAMLVSILKENEVIALDSYRELSIKSRGGSRISNPPPIEEWKLWELIAVAEAMGKLDSDTRRQADILRDYRNLIHPLVEIRRGTELDEELVQAQIILLTRVTRLLSR